MRKFLFAPIRVAPVRGSKVAPAEEVPPNARQKHQNCQKHQAFNAGPVPCLDVDDEGTPAAVERRRLGPLSGVAGWRGVMVRRFNTAGPCRPGYHYMILPLRRLPEAPALVAAIRAAFEELVNFIPGLAQGRLLSPLPGAAVAARVKSLETAITRAQPRDIIAESSRR